MNDKIRKSRMPLVGLGLAGIVEPNSAEIIERSVEKAVEIGYKFFDSAYIYGNEKPIGNALKRCMETEKVTRKDLYIVTKLPGIAMHPERVEEFLRRSLLNLQMNYVDLYLIHWPLGFVYNGDANLIFPKFEDGTLRLDKSTNLESIWKSMEKMVDLGLTKEIGLSNFNEKQIERILTVCKIPPKNLQVELNVYFQQRQLVNFCKSREISLCAYAPLGSPGRAKLYRNRGLTVTVDNLLEDEVVTEIAETHVKTPAQISLRFLIQQNIAVIPRSTNLQRLESNFQIDDFKLTDDEMERLSKLDKGPPGRFFDFSVALEAREHPEFPF